ncbi:MAG TPA: 2-succinyl-5-enolpyruvyl-6-hydroxy-3-cyclohexene-1-carboxylic-acid synthase [Opitutaceae bacterium]|nr:2-succinyl-5-enolpyruvyl-6-hydroxy-3-cyclohexene-1-carboxylic-acid synthase [Opitutaceae bacterium]
MKPPALDFRNLNALWASVLVEALSRSGVRRAVISPGSRSTPLAFAFALHPQFEAIPVLDERSAGFFALGMAKQDMRPVALLCTSGTAGANYYPAVIESHEAGVPLIVITADRPPEMRGCASGQTIDQHRLYGSFVRYHHDLAVPEASAPLLRYLRQTAAHAVERSLAPLAGPVHINAPFRDPLAPVSDGGAAEKFAAGVDWVAFFDHLAPPAPVMAVSEVPALSHSVHGVIIVGPLPDADGAAHSAAVGEISRRLGWPVLADGLSAVRNHAASVPHLVARYDAVLRNPAAAESLRPEFVLCLGEWPTSKVLRDWVESSGAPVFFATERPDNRDALHGPTRRIVIPLHALALGLPTADAPNGYERLWAGCEARTRAALDSRLASEEALIEPKAAWLLGHHLPPRTTVCVANSMPVRDMEFVWPANDTGARIVFNRGANGIDGTLSTALGVAHGGAPCVLLTGDLALLHDSNGFMIAPKFKGSLTVVLINNQGSGIFEHLPVAQFDPVFEEFFAAPQEVDFSRLCGAHGVEHVHVEDWFHFESLVSKLQSSGIRVLEIRADRKRDAAWRKEAFSSAGSQAL